LRRSSISIVPVSLYFLWSRTPARRCSVRTGGMCWRWGKTATRIPDRHSSPTRKFVPCSWVATRCLCVLTHACVPQWPRQSCVLHARIGGVQTRDEGSHVLQLIVYGLISGSILALGAIGLTLIYGILNFANFAHGDLMALGAYLALFFRASLALPMWLAFVL